MEKLSGFELIPQYNEKVTREVVSVNYKRKNKTEDSQEIVVTYKNGVEVRLSNHNTFKKLDLNTATLLDFLIREFSCINSYGESDMELLISASLETYMTYRGWKITKDNKYKRKKQVEKSLKTLASVTCVYEEVDRKKGKESENVGAISLFLLVNVDRSGTITAHFNPYYAKLLNNGYILHLPDNLGSVSNQLTYCLGRWLYEYYLMNSNSFKKKDGYILLSVKSILENMSDFIPSYEQVSNTTRQISRDIISPLESALDELESKDYLKWEYSNAKQKPLTEAQLSAFNYEIFEESYIKYKLLKTPEERVSRNRKNNVAEVEPTNYSLADLKGR